MIFFSFLFGLQLLITNQKQLAIGGWQPANRAMKEMVANQIFIVQSVLALTASCM